MTVLRAWIFLTSIEDVLYIMTGLGLVDQVSENVFGANAITKHLADWAGATNGALHLFVNLPEK